MAKKKKYQVDLDVPVDEEQLFNDTTKDEVLPEQDTFPDVPGDEYYPIVRTAEIETVWKEWLIKVCNMEASLVRLAHTSHMAEMPKPSVNWISFYISAKPTYYRPDVYHFDQENGYSVYSDTLDEEITIYCIGPNSQDMANFIRRTIFVEQNRYDFRRNNIGIKSISEPIYSPYTQNNEWIKQVVLKIGYIRTVNARYNERNLVDAAGEVKSSAGIDTYVDTATVQPSYTEVEGDE